MMRSLVACVLAGCALTSKSPPREQRYFSAAVAAPARHASASAPVLRIGRIALAPHLRGAIVHRDSGVELAPYETLRWSDSPDVYVRDALYRELFDARAFQLAVAGDVPVLDIDVIAFEEVRRGAARAGRVELRYVVRDDEHVLARGSVASDQPAMDSRIEGVVAAIRAALAAATLDLGDRLESIPR